jgi:SEC-C motif-containing protein
MKEDYLEKKCPCGTGDNFKDCCFPYINGDKKAPTAETLMRSRYSAFVVFEPEYIFNTHNPKTRTETSVEDISKWSKESEWLGLEIKNTEKGESHDSTGVVEFVASYSVEGKATKHHEVSTFNFIDGSWFFTDGKIIQEAIRRTTPKIGRNEPCPCGSGKKFKKCCG